MGLAGVRGSEVGTLSWRPGGSRSSGLGGARARARTGRTKTTKAREGTASVTPLFLHFEWEIFFPLMFIGFILTRSVADLWARVGYRVHHVE